MSAFSRNSLKEIEHSLSVAKLLVSSCEGVELLVRIRPEFIKALKRVQSAKETVIEGLRTEELIRERLPNNKLSAQSILLIPPSVSILRFLTTASQVIDTIESALNFQTVIASRSRAFSPTMLKNVFRARVKTFSAIETAAAQSGMFSVETFSKKADSMVTLGAGHVSLQLFDFNFEEIDNPSENDHGSDFTGEMVNLHRVGEFKKAIVENVLSALCESLMVYSAELGLLDGNLVGIDVPDFERRKRRLAQAEAILEAGSEIYEVARLSAQAFARVSSNDLAAAMLRLSEGDKDARRQ